MPWYAAHLVNYFKLIDGPQDSFTVWDNVVLVEAADEAQALKKAKSYGRLEAAEDDTPTVDDQPAEAIFAGVRKLSEVFHTGKDGVLTSSDEITFNEFVVDDEEAIVKLVKGEEITVNYLT